MTTILIIEDEPKIVAILSKGLKKAGHQTQAVLDGKQALPLALSGNFDLILLDLGLPGLSGMSVLREVRGQALPTPVIVVTALDNDAERRQALSLGANGFIAKPFRFKSILDAVSTHLPSFS